MASDGHGDEGKLMHTLPRAEAAHGHGGLDHVPHVLPIWIYLATWGTLIVLTAVTVTASYIDFGGSTNLVIALGIASIKACAVALMFMHLRYDHKFHAIIFSFAIVFLGIFISFTMFDTERRGQADAVQKDRPVSVQAPFRQAKIDGRLEEKLKRSYGLPPGVQLQPQNLSPPR